MSAVAFVPGLRVGHWSDPRRPTGCTVVLCEHGATGGVDVRGGAPGTRETDLLRPDNLVEQVHAVLLSGGSAFGLEAAAGVVRWLDERGHGFPVGSVRVPIVPAAVLFDLWPEVGDVRVRPDAQAGYAACQAASSGPVAQGNVGAGAGATVGKLFGIGRAMKGGLGVATLSAAGLTVGALVAVNAVGDVIDPGTGEPLAGARSADGRHLLNTARALAHGEVPASLLAGAATTIGVVATDAVLTKPQANKLATMAHAGLARAVNPVHTLTDGDTLFALATGAAGRSADLALLGTLAAEATARAVCAAVHHATALAGLPAARDLARPL